MRGQVYIGFWWGNVRESDYLEDVDFDGRPIIKRIFNGMWRVEWIGVIQHMDK
jgi:hypothetical protein